MIAEKYENGVRFVLDTVPNSTDFFLKAFRDDRRDGAIYQRYRPTADSAEGAIKEAEEVFAQFIADYRAGRFDTLWTTT